MFPRCSSVSTGAKSRAHDSCAINLLLHQVRILVSFLLGINDGAIAVGSISGTGLRLGAKRCDAFGIRVNRRCTAGGDGDLWVAA